MDEVLVGLDFAFCYLDDILISSSSEDEHLRHLQLVLQRLQQYGLVLNMEKCELGRQQVDFLGHRITAEGAAPIAKHVEAVQNFPRSHPSSSTSQPPPSHLSPLATHFPHHHP
jgi:hypothetical protein